MRQNVVAALLLAACSRAFAKTDIASTDAKKALQKIAHLKSMDMQDVMCDECLEEIDCIWPCEIMCVLDYPDEYAGKVCEICLEFYGCDGCKFLCPTPETDAPSAAPSGSPTYGPMDPTRSPTLSPTELPTIEPTAEPTILPTAAPSEMPTPEPTAEPTFPPSPSPTEAPTGEPTVPPTSDPSSSPTYYPTPRPSVPPTLVPTREHNPSNSPTISPSGEPTIEPTLAPSTVPSFAPSITPQFFLYYSEDDDHLYSFNPATDDEEYLFVGDFSGDLKIDSVNKFMFWSSPNLGKITKIDLTDDVKTEMLALRDADDNLGVMGIAVDPSRGELYYVNQLDMTINIIDYTATNNSVVHDISDYSLVPYGLEISPAELMAAGSDPGYLLFSCSDDLNGYIVYADLYGTDLQTLYTTSSKAIYGITLDAESDMMWWIENKGVANGVYSGPVWTDDFTATYVTYLEDAKWLAGVWDLGIIYTADYAEGQVYEFDLNTELGTIKETVAVAKPEHPRCIAFYYAASVDFTPGPMAHLAPKPEEGMYEPSTKESSLTGDVPGADIIKEHKDSSDANYDQFRSRTTAHVSEADSEDLAAQEEVSSGTNGGLFVAGGAVAAVAGVAALFMRRQRGYSEIQELSI